MNRRDFLKATTAAVVAASTGGALTAQQKQLVANYRNQYSPHYDQWVHRFSVRVGREVYVVDGMTDEQTLREHQVEEMLKALEHHIGENVSISVAA